jgi:hypothetical protein
MPIPKQRRSHNVVAQVPPVRGLNTTGAVAAMQPSDAMQMDNFISTDTGVQMREGWREYATGLGGEIRTIMSYEGSPALATTSPIQQSLLFAVTDEGIFDIEGGGDLSAELPMIALTGASFAGRMSYVMFTTDAGQYLIACSEVDGAFLYDGVAWMKMSSVGGPGPGFVTGADPAQFVQVCAWKKRLMFVQRDSTVAWILPVGQVGGAAVQFDFGPLMRFGGMLLALTNWTQDAGDGIDDRLVVLGTSGDMLIYEGTDPTNASEFRNTGTWFIGQPPVGRRCFTTAGGNVFVLTVFGVIPVTQVVQGGLDALETSGTEYFQQLRHIQAVLNFDFATLANTVGWEIMHFPNKALLHIARPSQVTNQWVQYAFQEHNVAWSRLLDIPGVTFGRRLEELYAGTEDGRVLRVHDGHTDGTVIDGTGAHEIRARVTPAFSYFGDPGVVKQALMVRVNFLASASPAYLVTMNSNFAVSPPGIAPTRGEFVGALWDEALWNVDLWAGARSAYGEWNSVEGIGYSLAPSIYVAAEQLTTIANIEYMMKSGGPM